MTLINKMKTVALISGGKDSCYNMMQCVAEGHEIVALANLKPKQADEIDSYMYQSVGHHAINHYAEAMGLPLYRREICGTSRATGRDYVKTEEDEVEDLYELLQMVMQDVEIEAVAVGAILSNYQRVRVENVCGRLGLTPLSYLWRRDQSELLDEMIQCQLEAIIIKVAALGLNPKAHLGKTLKEMQPYLQEKSVEYGLNVCGEGGEFETFTLDCPLFQKRIVINEAVTVVHSDDPFAPVGYLNLTKTQLEDKPQTPVPYCQYECVKDLPMMRSCNVYQELALQGECVEAPLPASVSSPSSEKCTGELSPQILRRGDHLWVTGLLSCYHDDLDVASLTRSALDRLSGILQLQGPDWSMASLVLVHLYVNNMADFAAINSVYKTYFGLNPASRVCVQAALPANVALLIDSYGCCDHNNRETMHVQGLSHWAPANIGPYSQCVKVGNRLYVAGQIGMVPANLSIILGGIRPQARLSLRHVASVLDAMATGCSINSVITCVCYITSHSYIEVANEEFNLGRKNTGSLCPVQYVVVPSLPKGALIEWQVTAVARHPEQTEDYLCICSDGDIECCLKCCYGDGDADTQSEDRQCLSVTGSIASIGGMLCKRSIPVDVISRLLDHCLSEVGHNCHLEMTQLPPLRLFYTSTIFKYQELYTALSKLTVNFILVPVKCHGVEGKIIAIST